MARGEKEVPEDEKLLHRWRKPGIKSVLAWRYDRKWEDCLVQTVYLCHVSFVDFLVFGFGGLAKWVFLLSVGTEEGRARWFMWS